LDCLQARLQSPWPEDLACPTSPCPPAHQPHSAHCGAFSAQWDGQRLAVTPHPADPAPSPILGNFTDALRHKARILRPAVRRGWLERGPGPTDQRGREDFVAPPWDEVLDRLAAELTRVKEQHGPQAVFGGSYGWSSAGRFHHAQSQVHRFLNVALGGYVRSVNSYSAGASQVILPHVMGRWRRCPAATSPGSRWSSTPSSC
jgi:biotin/methionine sulfoxide reductase